MKTFLLSLIALSLSVLVFQVTNLVNATQTAALTERERVELRAQAEAEAEAKRQAVAEGKAQMNELRNMDYKDAPENLKIHWVVVNVLLTWWFFGSIVGVTIVIEIVRDIIDSRKRAREIAEFARRRSQKKELSGPVGL